MKVQEVLSARWVDEAESSIDCELLLGDGRTIPYHATPYDTMPHGIQLWQELNAGDHGPIAAAELPPLADVRQAALDRLRAGADAAAAAARRKYPGVEQMTWPKQEQEAGAFSASGDPADAPLLDAIATARGVTLEVMVNKVQTKVAEFRALAGAVVGQRQALEDQVEAAYAADDRSALKAITWSDP